MRFIRGLGLGLVSLVVSQVFAGEMGAEAEADLPWFGVYLGGQLGGAWGRQKWDYVNPNYFNTASVVLLGSRFDFDPSSELGGGFVGVNYQRDNWLLGLEGAVSALNFNASRSSPFYPTDIYDMRASAYATAKARLGYVYDQWMLNLNGGYAGTNVGLSLVDPVFGISAYSGKFWANGWVVGIGLERKLFPSLILGVGYDYSEIRVNNQVVNCSSCGTGVGLGVPFVDGHLPVQSVMGRLSYLFS